LSAEVVIREATRDDVPTLLGLIAELAEYERAADQARGTPELLDAALFGADPTAEALIAERAGETVGCAIFYRTFSTWECRPGIWLEDLYVRPEHRRGGVGGLLVHRLAQIARSRGYARLEWEALEWNTPALSFYDKLGAILEHEWRTLRLDGDALERVADGSAPGGRS